jgi:LacI family transcriptional regulator
MTKRATMIDIAEKAGVSQATVSLVLGGVTNARISQDTRDKVRAIAEAMGYVRKSALGRGSEVKVIGLLIDEVLATPFAAQPRAGRLR